MKLLSLKAMWKQQHQQVGRVPRKNVGLCGLRVACSSSLVNLKWQFFAPGWGPFKVGWVGAGEGLMRG